MGQITSGVGLISGLPTADIISQLLAIDARPKTLVKNRIAVLQSQQAAFQDINAKLLALKVSVGTFAAERAFDATSASSSSATVLTASSTSSAAPGTYRFVVDRLVGTQQMIARGLPDQDGTALGATTLTFEFGDARLDADTELQVLNGGTGTVRGKIRITDRSGSSAQVDLSRALTADDVLEAINAAAGISVSASVNGDRFVLTDTSGATGTLSVRDVGNSGTAASLGLDAGAVGAVLTGNQVVRIAEGTELAGLNDGHGVDVGPGVAAHLRIHRRSGDAVDVDLNGATTIQDILDAISAQSGGTISARIGAAGLGLELTDNGPDLGTTFEVLSANGSTAAADLGILGADDDADGVLDGRRLLATSTRSS